MTPIVPELKTKLWGCALTPSIMQLNFFSKLSFQGLSLLQSCVCSDNSIKTGIHSQHTLLVFGTNEIYYCSNPESWFQLNLELIAYQACLSICRHVSGLERKYLKTTLSYHVYFEKFTLINALSKKLLDLKVETPAEHVSTAIWWNQNLQRTRMPKFNYKLRVQLDLGCVLPFVFGPMGVSI